MKAGMTETLAALPEGAQCDTWVRSQEHVHTPLNTLPEMPANSKRALRMHFKTFTRRCIKGDRVMSY